LPWWTHWRPEPGRLPERIIGAYAQTGHLSLRHRFCRRVGLVGRRTGRLQPARQSGVGGYHRVDPALPDGGLLPRRALGRSLPPPQHTLPDRRLGCLPHRRRALRRPSGTAAGVVGLRRVQRRLARRILRRRPHPAQRPCHVAGLPLPFHRPSAGQTAGRIYATSTAGSFLGAFLPDLLLVPTIGTRNTFVLLSLFLLAVALIGLARSNPRRLLLYFWMPAVIILLTLSC